MWALSTCGEPDEIKKNTDPENTTLFCKQARNVLLTKDTACKLADFGLARDVVRKDYYRLNAASAPIPVRWMAPEVLSHGMCSPAGERWSFGVLLWEIYSLGRQP